MQSPFGRSARRSASAVSVVVLVGLAGPACRAAVPATEGIPGLDALIDAYERVWDTHDPQALGAFFASDADLVMGNLPAAAGREAIEEWWSRYFARQEPERRLEIEVRSQRRLSEAVALVDVATTTGDGEGGALADRRARGTWVLERGEDGGWLVAAMRGMPTEEDEVELRASLETARRLRPDVRAFAQAYAAVFDRHDPEALTALYLPDADIVVRNAPIVRGREEILEWWRRYFATPRPYRVVLVVDRIRELGEDVVIVELTATGLPDEPQAPLRSARATWVLRREAGDWRIAALRVLPSEEDRIRRSFGD